jgi:hypothetical protein
VIPLVATRLSGLRLALGRKYTNVPLLVLLCEGSECLLISRMKILDPKVVLASHVCAKNSKATDTRVQSECRGERRSALCCSVAYKPASGPQ